MQVMEAPPGTWTVVVDLTDPLNVDGKPVTFRSLDTAAAELQLRAFRAAAIERMGRAGLRIRVEIDAPSPRHASDRLWQVIEKVFYLESAGPRFGSIRVRMAVTPAMTTATERAADHKAS